MSEIKRIEAMPYGSPRQLEAADRWWRRFVAWRERRWVEQEFEGEHTTNAWSKLLLRDVWYIAHQRYLCEKDTA